MKIPIGPRLTVSLELALMGAVLVFLSYRLTGVWVGSGLTALLAYEAWRLAMRDGSTLSEGIWALSARPIVPMVFGLGTGWLIFAGHVQDPFLILVIGFLLGHFFFQRQA